MTRQPKYCIDPQTDNVIQPKGYPYVRPKQRKYRKSRKSGYELDIDPKMVEQLARIQCTTQEIASVLGIDQQTVIQNFNDAITKGKSSGNADLRRAQWRKAVVDKNPSMLIWLGKQYLGQSDESRIQITAETDVRTLLNKWEAIDVQASDIKPAVIKQSLKDVQAVMTKAIEYEDIATKHDASLEAANGPLAHRRRDKFGRLKDD
jgi:hypothetical protein